MNRYKCPDCKGYQYTANSHAAHFSDSDKEGGNIKAAHGRQSVKRQGQTPKKSIQERTDKVKMSNAEKDDIASEKGTSLNTTPEQDELITHYGQYNKNINFIFSIMKGANK